MLLKYRALKIKLCYFTAISKYTYQLTKEEAQSLIKKAKVFTTRTKINKQIHWVLITNLPIKKTLYSEELIVKNVVLDDLMK